MELEIYKEKKEKDAVVRLMLKDEGGDINVIVVDEDGEQITGGYLMTFNEDGTIYRPAGFRADLGFKKNKKGQLMIEGEEKK